MTGGMIRALFALALAAPALGSYEWAATFATTADDTYTWSAQAVGCSYADPTMKLVMIATTDTSSTNLDAQATALETLMDGSCTVVNPGDTMTPTTAGVCYTLTFSTTVDATTGYTDSTFTIDTTGVDGIIFAGQHVPTEFERDAHYLYTSAGVDEEPIAESSGATRYAYFTCSSDFATISYGEECIDDVCTAADCGIGETDVASPATYIAGGYVHTAACETDGTITVKIYEDNTLTTASDLTGLTPDQTHSETSGCAVEEHDHSSGDDTTTAACSTVSGASSTRLGLGGLLVAGLAFAFAN